MTHFSYTYRTSQGTLSTGSLTAADRRQALILLKKQGIVVFKLAAESEAKALKKKVGRSKKSVLDYLFSFKSQNSGNGSSTTSQDKSTQRRIEADVSGINSAPSPIGGGTTAKGEGIGLNLLKRLYELHKSGMPIGDAIRILQNRLSERTQKNLAVGIWRDLSEGLTLAQALARRRRYFTPSISHVIQAGEATGNLCPVLEKVIQYLDEKRAIRKKMIASMTYPAFVSLVAVLVVILFLTVLLPQIEGMLQRLGGEMTWSAQLLIDGSNLLLKSGPFILISIFFLFIGLRQWKQTNLGKQIIDRWSLKMPLIGKILYYSSLYQTGNLIGTLLQSGINTTETLQLTEKTIENAALKQKFTIAKGQINEGASVTQAFRRQNFMPEVALDILSVGEDTGALANSMNDVTEGFKEELSQRLNRLTTIVSSLALGFAFGLVTLIAIGIVTSVFEVSKTLSL